jgi:hypothetical protein
MKRLADLPICRRTRQCRFLALAGVTLGFLVMAQTASASFNVLASYSATTSAGQTCTMHILGGSDSRSLNVFSNIDFGIQFWCLDPSYGRTLESSWADVSMKPANTSDPLDGVGQGTGMISDYVNRETGASSSESQSAGCNGPYGAGDPGTDPDRCFNGHTYHEGIPGHRYAIYSQFELALPSGVSWSSYPSSICSDHGGSTGLSCYPPTQYVTGF